MLYFKETQQAAAFPSFEDGNYHGILKSLFVLFFAAFIIRAIYFAGKSQVPVNQKIL